MEPGSRYLSIREDLFFKTAAPEFENRCTILIKDFEESLREAGPEARCGLLGQLAELILDLASYLPRWHLQSPESTTRLDDECLDRMRGVLLRLLEEHESHEQISRVKNEIEELKNSNFRKMSVLSDQGILNTRWGNDSAVGLIRAMRRGAVIATINPVMINEVRKIDPGRWDKVKRRLQQQNPDNSPVEMASCMTMEVGLANCRELRPIYEATAGRYGYVCLQVNPQNAADPGKMVDEAARLYRDLAEQLGGAPNVTFKIPGTRAGLEAVREITSRGIPVTVTACASIGQHLAFAREIEKGTAPVSCLTLMNGRLDDPVRDELLKLGIPDALEASRWASTAVIRKSYGLLYCDHDYCRSVLLAASMRGPWNVEGSITDGKREIIITAFPDRAIEYDSEERECASCISENPPPGIMQTLERSTIFHDAYHPERLSPDDFDDFHPVAASLGQFTASYEEFLQYVVQ